MPFDPALLFEPDQRRIQRSLVQRQRVLGDLLEPCRQRVGMQWPHRRQRAQHDQVEGSLEQFDAFTRHPSGICAFSTWMSSALCVSPIDSR
jgi:hypothetical protein